MKHGDKKRVDGGFLKTEYRRCLSLSLERALSSKIQKAFFDFFFQKKISCTICENEFEILFQYISWSAITVTKTITKVVTITILLQ